MYAYITRACVPRVLRILLRDLLFTGRESIIENGWINIFGSLESLQVIVDVLGVPLSLFIP